MKRVFKVSLVLASLTLLLASCNCYKKMEKKAAVIQTTCAPTVLTLQGKEVKATYTVEFPAKYFNKKAVLRITPVLVYDGGELAGTPTYVQGISVKDNYTVISDQGGKISQSVSFPYSDKMNKSTLVLRIDSKCSSGSSKTKVFAPFTIITVANGVSTIQNLADLSGKPALIADNFKRNTVISQDAKVMFLVNKSDVRAAQLNNQDIKTLEQFIIDNSGDSKKSVSNIYTKAYASPEGPLDLNNKLSQQRGRNTEAALKSKYQKEKSPVQPKFDVEALGEDWEGFKALVAASDIQDKDLILNVLKMYDNPEKRDAEIKNMSSAFNVLKEKILPQLRRSKLQVDVNVQGMSDAEIKNAISQNISKLNVDELLFAATLYSDNADKAKIYKAAADKFNDYRAWNNYACVLLEQGKASEAAAALNTAAKLNNSSNEVINNLGLASLMSGNYADAKRYFSSINSAEAKYNTGLVNLANGSYSEASKSLDGYNLAVAEVLNGNLSKAKSLLSNVNTAEGDYLKAVISAREGDSMGVIGNLKSATSKSSELKAKAKSDVEFSKWFNSTEFKAIVG